MDRAPRSGRAMSLIAIICLLAAVSAWQLFSGTEKRSGPQGALSSSERRPSGYPQLVSIERLPKMDGDGEMCIWEPAGTNTQPLAALRQESPLARPASGSRSSVDIDRVPLRTIRDPNPSYSAVAVAPEQNMLVLTDENLFRVMEYDRRDNTPPSAKMTEPKRVIGGNLTKAEMMCGVYIDPKTLDTYVVNNDTQNWLVVFSKDARGNVAPDRYLAAPQAFGIAVDEGRQELFLTVQEEHAVVVYRKMASGNEAPLRRLRGDGTQLEDPHGVALDTKRNLLIVSNHGSVSYHGKRDGSPESRGGGGDEGSRFSYMPGSGQFEPPSITFYPLDAKGNTAPLRMIEGPKTRLNWPAQIAVDEERGEIYVANDMDHSLLVFQVTDSGDVAPTRIVRGPKTGIRNPTGVALDLQYREVWVANMGAHSATVFPMTANGDVPPLRIIRGGPVEEPSLMIGNPGGVGYDSKREEILVPN